MNRRDALKQLAWLWSQRIVHQVWRDLIGTPLTVSHGFPRSAAQRDRLQSLTALFVAQQWSLRELVMAIVTDPVFNRAPPVVGCDRDNPYPLDAALQPFSSEEEHPGMQANSVGDAVVRLPARVLLRRTYAALGWTLPGEVISETEAYDQGEIGVFNTDAQPEHGGVDLQTLFAWENRHGACMPPTTWTDKFPDAKPSYTSCKGRCGGGGEFGFECFCDGSCALFDDCCDDFAASCAMETSAAPGGDTLDQLEATALAAGATQTTACATLIQPAKAAGYTLQCDAAPLSIQPL